MIGGTSYSMGIAISVTWMLALSGCSDYPRGGIEPINEGPNVVRPVDRSDEPVPLSAEGPQLFDGRIEASSAGTNQLQAQRYPGTDRSIGPGATAPRAEVVFEGGEALLNFEEADLRDVVRVVLADVLGANYIYDDRVTGRVTMQTVEPVDRETALGLLETLLRSNGGALLRDGDGFRVVPADQAVEGRAVAQLGGRGDIPTGYTIRVLPLSFVSAAQIERILEPVKPPTAIVRTDRDRNVLLVAGSSSDVTNLIDTAQIFDVDFLAGKSVGIYPLSFVTPDILADELSEVFANTNDGPLSGVVEFVPLERLNALMVISQRQRYLADAESWIRRLDRGSPTGENLYVLNVEHAKATELAALLGEAFGDEAEVRNAGRRNVGNVAPNREAQEAVGGVILENPVDAQGFVDPGAIGGPQLRIIADEANNSLLVKGDERQFRMVEAAVRRLDVRPLQVLIEATIVEVRLTNDLRFGVQYYFENSGGSAGTFRGTLSSVANAAIGPAGAGFTYILTNDAGDRSFVLEALETLTQVRIVSSPYVMIQDNQSAELQVGDEVPVVTQQQQSTTGESNLVNTVQFRDTGVILRVTPRLSAGGTINLEIEQEVSNVVDQPGAGDESTLTPTISQRKINSSVTLFSGDTLILGGLISEDQESGSSGIPFLSRLPVVGALFGTKDELFDRQELMVLITPRLISDPREARTATNEVRERMRQLRYTEQFSLF